MSVVTLERGVLRVQSGGSIYGQLLSGVGWDATISKSRQLLLDRSSTAPAVLNGANHGEYIQTDVAGVTESGLSVYANAPSTAGSGASHSKVALAGSVTTAEVSNFGGSVIYQAVGVYSSAATSGTVSEGNLTSLYALAQTTTGTDATSSCLYGLFVNQGTNVTTVATAKSKYGIFLQSAGSAKNTAFLYAAKGAVSGGIAAANCSHGILVDGASTDANPFAVVSGTTPTVLWGVTPTGGVKELRADATNATVAAVTASGMCGLINFSAAATLAAVTTIDAVITNTFVNANSVITLTPGVMTVAAGSWIIPTVAAVGAGSWTLRLYNPGAATATGAAGVINVYYRVTNSN
jgi:hypothetical protein